jgi:hypothetical protein
MAVRRLVIDVLIPHEPGVLLYAEKLSDLDCTDALTIVVQEIDEQTKTLRMTIEGEDLSYKSIQKVIEELGGSVHSIDQVSAGSRTVECRPGSRIE